MPYNPETAGRMENILKQKKANFTDKKMFSGICFMVNDKMCCATHIDKVSGEDVMLCRLSPEDYTKALKLPHVIPMDFTGKTMKGYIYVKQPGISTDKDMSYWIQLCLDFNPLAKASAKKKR